MAAIVAVVAVAAAGAARAGITATLTREQPVAVVGLVFPVDITVVNNGAADVVFGESDVYSHDLSGSPALGVTGEFAVGKGGNSTGVTVAPGASRTFRAVVRPDVPGLWNLTGNIQGRDTAAGTVSASAILSVTVFSAAQVEALHPLGPGSIEIRRNVIRIRSESTTDRALIVVKGPPGGVVNLSVIGPSGARIGALMVDRAGNEGVGISWVNLGSDGVGTAAITGAVAGGLLGTGVYWVVASGAVKDRKPFMVISGK